jgi:hypothetical protein
MCLNGSFKMTAFRNRLLGLAAGTLALSSFSSMAYAQTTQEVFDFSASKQLGSAGRSTFTFGSSLILNSIGFVYDSSIVAADYSFVYSIGGPSTIPTFLTVAETRLDSTGFIRYYDLPNPTAYAAGTEVAVISFIGNLGPSARTGFTDNAVGVTHSNEAGSTFAAGNLRVTALGGSVAPEPGTFALALTGGAALIGICIRRRRNAA